MRWVVAFSDGSSPRIVDAASAERAVQARLEDEHDPVEAGELVEVWRLGNYPELFEAGRRSLGRPGTVAR